MGRMTFSAISVARSGEADFGFCLSGEGFFKKIAAEKDFQEDCKGRIQMGSFYCPQCGRPTESGDAFCVGCGARLGGTPAGKTAVGKGSLNSRKMADNKMLIVGIVAIVLLVIAAVWYLTSRNSIVGKWSITENGESVVLTFEENGYGSIIAEDAGEMVEFGFLYETKGKMLTLSMSANGMTESRTIPYRIDGKKMFWTDPQTGEETVFEKIS